MPFLARLRKRLKHAWLLHAWLVIALLLMPAGRLARADGDGFEYTRTESSKAVTAYVDDANGTSGMTVGSSRQVIANVQLNTWEVWTDTVSGATEIRNPLTTSMQGASLGFSASGNGSISPGTGTTDASGNAIASFTMGTAASTVTVTEGGSGATGSVTFDNPTETWHWDHDESLIAAALSTTDSTENVPNGAARAVQAHVELHTWSVYVSNLGNTQTDDNGTSPAIGAQVSWSIESGAGSVSPGSSATDSSGNAVTTFTMGSATSVVRGDVSYGTANSTYATLQFTAEETWTLDHVVSSVSGLTLSANGSTDALDPGTQRTVTAAVTSYSYEVWVSNYNNTEYRNGNTLPAEGVYVTFSVSYGNGSLSSTSATTGNDGNAAVTFTMGSQDSGVSASGGGYSATMDFYRGAETWHYDHSESDLSFSEFNADGTTNDLRPDNTRTLTAEVMSNSWEVWLSNYDNTEIRNYSTDPASNVTVGFNVSSGDGQLYSVSSTTDSSGHAAVGFTMGSASSTVQADVNDGTHPAISTSIRLSLGDPVWRYDHTETTISTTLTADGSTDSLPVGAVRGVTVNVTFNSWEVWLDDTINSQNRNYASGAANGASMYFSVTNGDGTLSNVASSTDSNGNAMATFTMGTQTSTVQADASYASASSSGTITFTPDSWIYDHAGGPVLSVSLSADDTTSVATATVTVTTWDVYSNGSGSYEDRNISTGPAGNAYVNFSADGDVTVDTASTQANAAGIATTGYALPAEGGEGNITADASFSGACDSDTVPVKQEGFEKSGKVEASNGTALQLMPANPDAPQFGILLSGLAQYKQLDGTYLVPKTALPEAQRDVPMILAAIFGATAEFKAIFQKKSAADAADWWQEKNINDEKWEADGPAAGAGEHADKTVTFNDSPGGRSYADGAVKTLADGTIKITPPADPFPINPSLGVLKMRFRVHLKVNGDEKGYYEWGVDIDVSKTPPVTKVDPEWHSN